MKLPGDRVLTCTMPTESLLKKGTELWTFSKLDFDMRQLRALIVEKGRPE